MRRMQKGGAQTWWLLSRTNVDLILGGGFVLKSHLRLSCLYRAPTHERAPGELCEKISFLFIYKKSYLVDALKRAFCAELKAAQFN